MIFFDLDGVIRNLHYLICGKYPDSWNAEYGGRNIFEVIHDTPSILYDSPPTEYYDIVKKLKIVHILSCQPQNWRALTTKWLNKYLPQAIIIYTNKPDQKFNYMNSDDILFEDSPNLHSYDQIVLVRRPYNENINCIYCVNNVIDFEKYLKKFSK